jgi:hypothetical protein
VYEELYPLYRTLHDALEQEWTNPYSVMKQLLEIHASES